MAKFAVILAGSGVFDGSEIHEATSTLIAIKKHGGDYACFAPNRNQAQVINHLTGEAVNEKRNILEESARIARGDILPLSDYTPDNYDALILPGGFGVAKNFFSFAFDGLKCSIQDDVKDVILKTYDAGKYIGAMCVAPGVVVRALKDAGVKVKATGGDEALLCELIDTMGGGNLECAVTECVVDESHKIVTTPAYTSAQNPWEVFQGVDSLISFIVKHI
jgi:enhancing lycopene biosynthesis protein 2